jgi:hypothetical protein
VIQSCGVAYSRHGLSPGGAGRPACLAGRWFFLYGFAKNERGTLVERELAALQMTAEALLEMDLPSLEMALQAGELTEICDEEEPHTG